MARGLGKGIGALFPTETLDNLQHNEDQIEKIELQKLKGYLLGRNSVTKI